MNRIIITGCIFLLSGLIAGCGGPPQQARNGESPDSPKKTSTDESGDQTTDPDEGDPSEEPVKPDGDETKEKAEDKRETPSETPADNEATEDSDPKDDEGNGEASDDPADESENETAAASLDSPADDAPAEVAEPDYGVERLVMLTARGPLLVELQLSIDGKPHTGAMERLIDYVLKVADENGDQVVTWDELTESPRFRYGQLGNVAFNTEADRRNAIRMYDLDSNNKVDRSEVPRFITRNAGGSRPFSFRGSNYYRDINRRDSPIRLLLDADEDGRLTADEIDEAPIRLRSRDVDNDDLLYPTEIVRPTQEQVGIFARKRVSVPDSAVYVGDNNQSSKVLYALEEQYALGRRLTATAFEIAPALFAELDGDGDGEIDKNEIGALASATPQLVLRARFGGEGKRFELVSISEELGARDQIVVEGENRLTINVPGLELICFYRDNQVEAPVEQRAMAELMRYDADKNNYIDEEEAPDRLFGMEEGFAAVDLNDDKKIYLEELVEYTTNSRVAYFSQIHSRAGDNNDVMFGALDKNSDGRLDSREISSVRGQLMMLDTDKDGNVSMRELPDAMALGVARGNPQQVDALFAIPIDQPATSPNAPRWFQRMDANNDGAISQAEFLGEVAQFTELDSDNNGFVEFTEIKVEGVGEPFEAPSRAVSL